MSSNSNGSNSAKGISTANTMSVLGLATTQPTGNLGLMPYSATRREVSREESRVLQEFRREELIIDLSAEKGKLGIRKLGEVQQCATDLFGETVTSMLDSKNRAKGTEAQAYVEEFTMHQIQMYARHMLGTLEVVGTNIGLEVHRSLNLPPEQRGFWARLLDK